MHDSVSQCVIDMYVNLCSVCNYTYLHNISRWAFIPSENTAYSELPKTIKVCHCMTVSAACRMSTRSEPDPSRIASVSRC